MITQAQSVFWEPALAWMSHWPALCVLILLFLNITYYTDVGKAENKAFSSPRMRMLHEESPSVGGGSFSPFFPFSSYYNRPFKSC